MNIKEFTEEYLPFSVMLYTAIAVEVVVLVWGLFI